MTCPPGWSDAGDLPTAIDDARRRVVLWGHGAWLNDAAIGSLRAALARGVSVVQAVGSQETDANASAVAELLMGALIGRHDYRVVLTDESQGEQQRDGSLAIDERTFGTEMTADELCSRVARWPTIGALYDSHTDHDRRLWQELMAAVEATFDRRWLFKPAPSVAVRPPATVRRMVPTAGDDPDVEWQAVLRSERAANFERCLAAGAEVRDLHVVEALEGFLNGATDATCEDAASVLEHMRELASRFANFQAAAVPASRLAVQGVSFEIVRRAGDGTVLIDAAPGRRAAVTHPSVVAAFERIFDTMWGGASRLDR